MFKVPHNKKAQPFPIELHSPGGERGIVKA